MENLAQVVPGFLKLVHYAASGMGSVAGTTLAPWKARREALARQIAAQGEACSLRILAEGQASAVQIISEANEEARSTLMGDNTLTVTKSTSEKPFGRDSNSKKRNGRATSSLS